MNDLDLFLQLPMAAQLSCLFLLPAQPAFCWPFLPRRGGIASFSVEPGSSLHCSRGRAGDADRLAASRAPCTVSEVAWHRTGNLDYFDED
jgi:hypothetical protein